MPGMGGGRAREFLCPADCRHFDMYEKTAEARRVKRDLPLFEKTAEARRVKRGVHPNLNLRGTRNSTFKQMKDPTQRYADRHAPLCKRFGSARVAKNQSDSCQVYLRA